MNSGYTYHDIVRRDSAGMAVLDFYAVYYPKLAREAWRERIANGQVRLNDEVASADVILRAGDRLAYHRPPWEEPAAPTELPVVLEDGELLVVNKPAGLPVLPGGGFLENTAVRLLRRARPELRCLSPTHCLDRGTSGLLVFGKNRAALSGLGRALQRRRVGRVYLAVLEGLVEQEEFLVAAPIGIEPHPLLGPQHVANAAGKASQTDFRVLDRDESARTTLVLAMPHTGRTHQIRIHAAVSGHPLEGEPFFRKGGKWAAAGERPEAGTERQEAGSGMDWARVPLPGDSGYRLHAWQLQFDHPGSGEALRLSCPPPEGFWSRPAWEGVAWPW